MLNDRMRCNDQSLTSGMTLTLILKPASVRLHLVDFHRTLFYDRLDSYDLFVYTEVSLNLLPSRRTATNFDTRHNLNK